MCSVLWEEQWIYARNDLEKSDFLMEVRRKSSVGRIDEGAQHEETVQVKKVPKDFVQEDKDEVIKVSRKE